MKAEETIRVFCVEDGPSGTQFGVTESFQQACELAEQAMLDDNHSYDVVELCEEEDEEVKERFRLSPDGKWRSIWVR